MTIAEMLRALFDALSNALTTVFDAIMGFRPGDYVTHFFICAAVVTIVVVLVAEARKRKKDIAVTEWEVRAHMRHPEIHARWETENVVISRKGDTRKPSNEEAVKLIADQHGRHTHEQHIKGISRIRK